MSNVNSVPLLDSEHCQAICEEVGERLRIQLGRETSELPPRLRLLLDRFAEQESEETPSIVPAMDDMATWSTAAS
jgi:hypothetical protein